MSELTLTVMRLGFLAVLWLFVIVAVQVIRSDLFGTRVTQRGSRREAGRQQQAARQAAAPPQQRGQQGGGRQRRNAPSKLVVSEGTLTGTTVRWRCKPGTTHARAQSRKAARPTTVAGVPTAPRGPMMLVGGIRIRRTT